MTLLKTLMFHGGILPGEFGEEVATLVDGVTKLTKLELADIDEAITENEKTSRKFSQAFAGCRR